MRIVLDAMGSDDCPEPELSAALQAARTFGDQIILVGPKNLLKPRLDELGATENEVLLVDATDVITMEDKGLSLALKAKRPNAKNSMAIGMDLVTNDEADAFVTAGNTGGALATAYYRMGLIKGVERPALSVFLPVKDGQCLILDIGANPDCKPEHLYQFAIMGALYVEKVREIKEPKIGLMSNGEEAGKGNQLIKDTFPILASSALNFVGNVESKELYAGEVDVVVTDGFTGNVVVKTSEAVAKLIVEVLRTELTSSTRTKVGALLAKPAFTGIRKMMDPAETGAAPLLGVDGLVYIGHGRSDARALVNAIRTARQGVAADFLGELRTAVQEHLASIPIQEVS
jgi:glycerol-3-phosphate acyltransferase PlsX